MRKYAALLIIVLFSSMTVAAGFGSVAYTTSKQIEGLETSFRLGVLNLGDDTREITLSADTGDAVSVRFEPRTLPLPPSTVTTEPSGSDWIHLGDGRYAKPVLLPFTVRINSSSGVRNHSIPVTVTARTSEETENGIRQNVVQSRQYTFSVYSSSPRLIQREDDDARSTDLFGVNRMEDTGAVNASPQDAVQAPETNESVTAEQKNITRGEQVSSEDERGGSTTAVLVVAIVVTALYILYEAL